MDAPEEVSPHGIKKGFLYHAGAEIMPRSVVDVHWQRGKIVPVERSGEAPRPTE